MNVELTLTEYTTFLRNIKDRELRMYTYLLAMSVGGKCTKTQYEIADALGIHLSTVQKRIKEVNAISVKGMKLVRTVRESEQNVYYILSVTTTTQPNDCIQPNDHVTINYNSLDSNKDQELKDIIQPIDQHPCRTPTDAIKYFCEKYEEQYGEQYMPVWIRDVKNVRDKISKVRTPDQIKETIDVLIRLYPKMWSTQGYPRPSINSLIFKFPQALAYAEANRKEAEAYDEFADVEITLEDGQDIFDVYDKRYGL